MRETHVRMAQARFVPLIQSGAKRQTVRLVPRRELKAGEKLSIRQWEGKPYKSKMLPVLDTTIAAIDPFYMTPVGDFYLNDIELTGLDKEEFARADGFSSSREMFEWFRATHKLPFYGQVIRW